MSTISNSISETNRQRALIGLAPLSELTSESRSEPPVTGRDIGEDEENERKRVEEIRAELARRKEKRVIQSKVMGQSLGESLISQTAGSAKDWIERSRKIGLSEAKKAEATIAAVAAAEAAAVNDHAYTSRDLAGTKIGHDFADFEKGGEVVLTLKDSRILQGVADGLNEEEDELMNQDLADQERQKILNARRQRMKSKSSQRYDVYGEEEAELLAKYSDEKEKAGVRLGSAGTLTAAEIEMQANSTIYAQDEARKEMNQLVYSLDDTLGGEKERKFQSDYKEVKFKKKKKPSTLTNGKSEVDNSCLDNLDPGDSSVSTSVAGILKKKSSSRRTKAPTAVFDYLPEPSPQDRASELSSRAGPSARQQREAEEERLMKEAKDARYLKAIQAAEAMTHQRNELDKIQAAATGMALHGVPPPPASAPPKEAFQLPPSPPPSPPAAIANLWEEEEDDLLAQSLARARRIAQSKKLHHGNDVDDSSPLVTAPIDSSASSSSATNSAVLGEEASVRALAQRVKESNHRVKLESENGSSASPLSSSSSSSSLTPHVQLAAPRLPPGMKLKAPAEGLIFTTTTEFVRGLQTVDAPIVKKEPTVKTESIAASTSSANGHAPMEIEGRHEEKKVEVSDATIKSDHADEDDMIDGDRGVYADNGDGDGDDVDADESIDSSDVSDDDLYGGDSALTGVAAALRHLKNRGVLKEGSGTRTSSMADTYGAEKYDAFGREQSMKEQFRFISHRFHGIEAGLSKQEKRLNRVQQEAQRRQALIEQGGVAEKIAEKQRQSGAAGVVLDKKLHAELEIGASSTVRGSPRGKKRKESGPFAQFGHGHGGYAYKKRKAEEAAARKAAVTPSNHGQ